MDTDLRRELDEQRAMVRALEGDYFEMRDKYHALVERPCADPTHQHAVAEAAELRRLVGALVSNACSRDLAAALRSLNEGHAADESEGERQFEREWEAAEFRAAYEGSGG